MPNYSPLRYPGGKGKMYQFIKKVIENNDLLGCEYIEPFAGGAGLALSLLMQGDVNSIRLNDYDRSIYALWHSLLYDTNEFIQCIYDLPVNLDTWYEMKKVQKKKDTSNLLELGVSTFYLNRTNRSGIIKGGLIGGIKQDGKYKMDCRFNKEKLIGRIEAISTYRDKIKIYNLDAEMFIENILSNLPEKSFTFFDPPYYHKAEGLYTNFYGHQDHIRLKDKVQKYMLTPYIITYDNSDNIKEIYKDMCVQNYDILYTASVKRKEKELIIYNENLKISV